MKKEKELYVLYQKEIFTIIPLILTKRVLQARQKVICRQNCLRRQLYSRKQRTVRSTSFRMLQNLVQFPQDHGRKVKVR